MIAPSVVRRRVDQTHPGARGRYRLTIAGRLAPLWCWHSRLRAAALRSGAGLTRLSDPPAAAATAGWWRRERCLCSRLWSA